MDEELLKQYDYYCKHMTKVDGVRFAGIINIRGQKIAGGFCTKVIPLEKDEKKMEMLLMETALDVSMRKEFNNSLGDLRAIVSYREKINIITIPYGENFILLSAETELPPSKIIEMVNYFLPIDETLEVPIL